MQRNYCLWERNGVKVSYIMPCFNRALLLEYNLKSLIKQTIKDFEIIITDNSTDKEEVKNVVSKFRKLGLNIKLFFVDPGLCSFSHDGNRFNPAAQQNVAVKKASGEIIVLTSPEVINASTNVENIIKQFNDSKSKFIYGWIDQMRKEEIGDIVKNNYDLNVIKKMCENNVADKMHGGPWCKRCWCRSSQYFLGSMRREDFIKIGGIDETFMGDIGWEDNEFAQRSDNNSIERFLDESIVGIHLQHERASWQGDSGATSSPNGQLCATKRANLVANVGYDWGSDDYIIGEY